MQSFLPDHPDIDGPDPCQCISHYTDADCDCIPPYTPCGFEKCQ